MRKKLIFQVISMIAVILSLVFFVSGCKDEIKLSIEEREITITIDQEFKVDVLDNVNEITWESEDSNVATVENGIIKAVGEGSTNILVKVGEHQTKIKVTVEKEKSDNFIVTWVNYDETILEVDVNVKKGVLPTYDSETPKREGYEFVGWDPELTEVTADVTYVAKFNIPNTCTVTWVNYDNEVLEVDENVPKGTLPTYDGETPTRTDFIFTGWDPEVTEVTADVTYVAQFMQEKVVTATWKNWDGTTLYVNHLVPYDTTPQYRGPTPTKESNELYDFMFIGWSPAAGAIKCHTTYTAQFAGIKRHYTVTWIDTAVYNPDTGSYRTVLYTEEVEAGTTPIYSGPELEKPDNVDYGYKYLFDGWDPIPSRLLQDMEFKAVYVRAYDAVWYNWYNEPEVLKQERYKMEEYTRPSGYKDVRIPDETPYEGETPRIFDDYGYSYEFLGWFSNDESRSWNDLPMTKTLEREYLATYQCIPLEDNPYQVDKFTYRIYDDYYYPACIITGYTGDDMTDLYIPTWIDGYMVIGIGTNAFRDNNKIINLYIGDNVRRLGYNTFSGCKNLSSIMFGLNMTYLGEDMFENCTSLNRVDIPEQITEIGYSCFSGCTSLMAVTLPDNLETIGSGAFNGCEWLTEITIPDKVKWVTGFSGCIRLKYVQLGAGVIGIANFCFDGDVALHEINLDKINLEHIGSYAFRECKSLATISLPDSLKTIGEKAFQDCTYLLQVNFFGSNPQLESIYKWAFLGCTDLTGLSIPASVTHIGEGIVGNCENLYSLKVTAGNQKYRSKNNMIIDIENQKIIAGCNGSGEIPTDETITVIGSYAFYMTKKFNLNKTLIIPNNIKK